LNDQSAPAIGTDRLTDIRASHFRDPRSYVAFFAKEKGKKKKKKKKKRRRRKKNIRVFGQRGDGSARWLRSRAFRTAVASGAR